MVFVPSGNATRRVALPLGFLGVAYAILYDLRQVLAAKSFPNFQHHRLRFPAKIDQ